LVPLAPLRFIGVPRR